jgi:hypothetical protein
MQGSGALFTRYVGLDLAVFSATGQDMLTFLQSQLTQDVARLQNHEAALAGYCTAQGRLLANMVLAPTPIEHQVLGLVKADVLPAFLKRLKMFVLRSKVSLEETEKKVSGLVVATDTLERAEEVLGHALPKTVWASVAAEDGIWVAAPSADPALMRWWCIADATQSAALTQTLGDDLLTHNDPADWNVMDLKAGLPWIEAGTQDLFIPQTVNLDLIEGVSFTKGCYPGQEVVARAHYRGIVKRRMQLGVFSASDATVKPGEDIFCPSDGPNPCGRVISMARDQDRMWLLFEAPLKHTQAQTETPLHAGAVDGPQLTPWALPYSVVPTPVA